MTRYAPQWLQSGSYAASLDRRLIGALWPAPASSGCLVSAVGTGMDVHVDPGQVAVPSPNNTGTVLCTSDAVETLTLAPAPPAGTDRVDLIVCQPRSVDLDGTSSQEDFIFAIVAGAEGAPPGAAPAVPAGTVALAQVHVAGGSASLVAGNITDRRPTGLAVPPTPAFAAAPPPLVGFIDASQGSKTAGSYTSAQYSLPAPLVSSRALIIWGGQHGFGSANSSVNATLKRVSPAQDLIGTGSFHVVASSTYAIPLLFGTIDPIAPGVVEKVFITYTITGGNNYFTPRIGYMIVPK